MTSALRISATGLAAQRIRLDVIANNLANAETTRTPQGGPYRRQLTVFEPKQEQDILALAGLGGEPTVGAGVLVSDVVPDPSDFQRAHNPGHPDADAQGYVLYPNVKVINEMVDLMSATRAYEANVAAINAAKTMTAKALDILR